MASNYNVISVASYNCLANEYLTHWRGKLNQEQQVYHDQAQFDVVKQNDLFNRIRKLDADVICLQEVSANYTTLLQRMGQLGYAGHYEQFNNKPDGVATFYKNNKFKNAQKYVLDFQDGTGRKALFFHLETHQGGIVDIGNTHLQGGQQNRNISDQEVQKLVSKVHQIANDTIICGDCNFTPQDPRFPVMSQSLRDALNGASTATSMNGTTPLRLDYIWHTATLHPLNASVDGKLHRFMTPEEPSDHIPVIASFGLNGLTPSPAPQTTYPPLYNPYTVPSPIYIPTSGVATRNNFPSGSFKNKIFNAFNQYMNLGWTQTVYDQFAPLLEEKIKRADAADQQQKGQFLPALLKEIVFTSQDVGHVRLFYDSFESEITRISHPLINNQPYNNTPSFRWTLFNDFNLEFQAQLGNRSEFYQILAPYFENCLSQADLLAQTQGGEFLTHLDTEIHRLPDGCAKNLFLQILSKHRPAETVIHVTCPNVPSDQELSIRGSGAGLNWTQDTPLKRIDWQTWEFRTAQPIHGEFEFKFLVKGKYENGPNHKITQGKNVGVTADFNTILSPIQKTIIEANFTPPTGKMLSVTGNGPLGNWDRKVPLKYLGNNKWFLSFDGQFPAFEFKFRLDDNWEVELQNNRRLECGKKDQISKIKF